MERSKEIPSNEFIKDEMHILIEKLGFLTSHVLLKISADGVLLGDSSRTFVNFTRKIFAKSFDGNCPFIDR